MAIKGETVIAGSSLSYINWPWFDLDDLTKVVGIAIAIFMAFLAYRKHKLEMKVLNRSLDNASEKGKEEHRK